MSGGSRETGIEHTARQRVCRCRSIEARGAEQPATAGKGEATTIDTQDGIEEEGKQTSAGMKEEKQRRKKKDLTRPVRVAISLRYLGQLLAQWDNIQTKFWQHNQTYNTC